jgi:hypothetical protein
MQRQYKYLLALLGATLFCVPLTARADNCDFCGQPIYGGTIYFVTDKITGEKKEACADCTKLPTCYICSLPVKTGGVELPDGRWLCARDAATAVLNKDEVVRISEQVKDDLDRLFSRFTTFPTNVEITVIDRIDVDSIFSAEGNAFESPDLLGYNRPEVVDDHTVYKIGLLTGMPLAQLKEACAHEYAHAWVGENVSKGRKASLSRDAEEGFCELVGYSLMDSQNETMEKKRVLQNRYTRGQLDLFIEAKQRFGFDQVMDWMAYGVAPELAAGHVEEIRDVQMPVRKPVAGEPVVYSGSNQPVSKPAPAPTTLKLEGISWGSRPTAIINGHTFMVQDQDKVPLGTTNVTIRCLEIREKSVRIQYVSSGMEQELLLPAK